jgi:hypothetical protein
MLLSGDADPSGVGQPSQRPQHALPLHTITRPPPSRSQGVVCLRASRVEKREKGDPLKSVLLRTAELVRWVENKAGTGFARKTLEQLSKLVGCCKETVRKAIRFLERHGLLDTFNVLSRDHGFVRRRANLYLIPDVESDPTPPPCDLAPSVKAPERPVGNSLAERLNRYAGFFGLRARAWGLNATPAPVGYRSARRHPTPS